MNLSKWRTDLTLIQLILSDLERHLHYSGHHLAAPGWSNLWLAFTHPRCIPLTIYRIAHALQKMGVLGRVIAKVLTWMNLFLFGIEIDSRCIIGPGCYLPHANGTVIGARSIGAGAVIYHQVTLGAKTPKVDQSGRPTVGEGVILGSGAKILGEIHLADGCIVAPNSLVLESTQAFTTVMGVPAIVIKQRISTTSAKQ